MQDKIEQLENKYDAWAIPKRDGRERNASTSKKKEIWKDELNHWYATLRNNVLRSNYTGFQKGKCNENILWCIESLIKTSNMFWV